MEVWRGGETQSREGGWCWSSRLIEPDVPSLHTIIKRHVPCGWVVCLPAPMLSCWLQHKQTMLLPLVFGRHATRRTFLWFLQLRRKLCPQMTPSGFHGSLAAWWSKQTFQGLCRSIWSSKPSGLCCLGNHEPTMLLASVDDPTLDARHCTTSCMSSCPSMATQELSVTSGCHSFAVCCCRSISRWNDPRLVSLNPEFAFLDHAILPLVFPGAARIMVCPCPDDEWQATVMSFAGLN